MDLIVSLKNTIDAAAASNLGNGKEGVGVERKVGGDVGAARR